MAQNQRGQNSGGQNQGGGQKKPQNFPKCPQCGTRPLPKDKEACPVCRPEFRIEVDLTRGAKRWQLLVQTYKNGIQENIPFAVDISGRNLTLIEATAKKNWQAPGMAVVPVDFSDCERKAGFHVIGGPANLRELEIPAEKPKSFKPAKLAKGQGFWANLLEGLKG